MPVTLGTSTAAGPDDTTSFTAVPGATSVPAGGAVAVTTPAGAVACGSALGAPAASFTAPSFCVAASTARPTTSGTATVVLPRDTIARTSLPARAVEPAS